MDTNCIKCGAKLFYDPNSEQIKCSSCNSVYNIDKDSNVGIKTLNNYKDSDEIKISSFCANCGASVDTTDNNFEGVCPYCRSPLKIETNSQVADGIIPFKFDKSQIPILIKKNVKRKLFLPKEFKKSQQLENISARYIPIIVFSGNTFSKYSAVLVYKIYNERENNYSYSHRKVYGNINCDYNDVIVENCYKTLDSEIEDILPFNIDKMYKFNEDFLMGYPVEKEEDEITNKFENEAKSKIQNIIKDNIKSRYDCDSIEDLFVTTEYFDTKFQRLYVPIYFLEIKYKNKIYKPIINGQTGKVGGNLPKSKLKIFFGVLIVLLPIIFVLLFLFLYSI